MTQTARRGAARLAPVAIRLRGELDTRALEEALRGVARRLDPWRGPLGEPAASAVRIPVVEVAEHQLPDAVREAAERPFHPGQEPPVRAVVFRVSPEDHVLLLSRVPGPVGARPLLDEVAHGYAPRLDRRDGTAERDAAPAGEAARWWEEYLSGLAPALDLPADRPRPVTPDPAAGTVPVEVPAPLLARVVAAAGRTGGTPFTVLLAAWSALVARVCGTDDVPVGVPEHGWGRADSAGAAGRTMVIRTRLSGDPTGRELLDRVGQGLLGVAGHVGAGAFERPFQVRLSVGDPLFPGLAAEPFEVPGRIAECELDLALRTHGDGLRGELLYWERLFTPRTAERLVTWYLALLDGMVAGLEVPVGAVPLEPVTGPLIAGPRRDFPVGRPLHSFIEEQADALPDALAVVAPDGSLTYSGLERRANTLAHRLIEAGVTADQPVAVLLEPSTDLVCALLGILKAGGGYLPLDVTYPAARIGAMLESAGALTAVTTREFAPAVTGTGRRVIALDDPAELAGRSAVRPQVPVDAGQLIHMIYTSGSTGSPKGVAVEHGSVVNYTHAVLERLGEVRGGSFAVVSTPAADFGLTCVFGALTTGGTVHLVAREVAMDPDAFAGYLAGHPVDVLKCVPSHLELLTSRGRVADVLPRELLVMSGEPCPWPLVDRVRAARPDLRVQSHYGHTESTMVSFVCETEAIPQDRHTGVVPLGTPLANLTGHLVDPAGRPLPMGVPGELVVRGPGVSRGYVGRPDLTADRFVPDPVTGDGRCYRSGDRLRHDWDGTLRFVGRTDDQVKVRGHRVEPGEVATALRELPDIAEAVVLAVGEGAARRLAAWLVPLAGRTVDVEATRSGLRERLPVYMLPATLTVLDRLPLTANGKIDRAALAASQPAGNASRAPLHTPTERRIGAVWAALLGADEVGADDDFFALGGDSFAAVRATRRIDPALRVIDLYAHSTVAELAAFLDGRGAGADDMADGQGPDRLLFRFGARGPAVPAATVVCVPYGGGSAAVFQPLAAALAVRDIAVAGVELPGHDPARPHEPPLAMADLVDRLVTEIAGSVSGPLVLYGHCAGTAVAVAVARRLESAGRPVLGVIAAGGFPVARIPGRLPGLVAELLGGHRWTADRIHLDAMRAGGATAGDLADSAIRTAVRGTRHDAREALLWFSRELRDPGRQKLRAPILALVGSADRVTDLYEERHHEWRAFSDHVALAVLPGAEHYFQRHQADRTADLLTTRLTAWLASGKQRPLADMPPRPLPALGTRGFFTLATGHLAALTGSALAAFGLAVGAYEHGGGTGGGAAGARGVALIALFAVLPLFLRKPLGRLLADRFDRRAVLAGCDLAAVLAFTAWTVLLTGGGTGAGWVGPLVVGVGSLAAAVRQPAYLSAAVQLLPKPYLAQLKVLTRTGAAAVGPAAGLLGAVLLGGTRPAWAVAVACLGCVVTGLSTTLAVRSPTALFRRRDEPFRRAFRGGLRFVARRPRLVAMIGFLAVAQYADAVLCAAALPFALATDSPSAVGVVLAAGSLAGLLGGAVMAVRGGFARRAVGVALCTVGSGAGALLMASGAPFLACGFALWCGCAVLRNTHWSALVAVKAGRSLGGRVRAVHTVVTGATAASGMLTVLLLADRAGALVTLAGIVLAGWGAAWSAARPVRRLEAVLPDVPPGAVAAGSLDREQEAADQEWHVKRYVKRSGAARPPVR